MQETLKQLFTSKKFLATLAGVIITLFAKVGLDVDNETAAMIVGLIGSFVVSQGIADNGKEKAKLESQSGGE